MNINIELAGAVPDYAMYTDLGNAAVHAVVMSARANNLNWAQTYRALRTLSNQDEFGEAMDTAVRECVYSALGFHNEHFYI